LNTDGQLAINPFAKWLRPNLDPVAGDLPRPFLGVQHPLFDFACYFGGSEANEKRKLVQTPVLVEKLFLRKIRKNKIASGCVLSDLLGSQDILYPANFDHFWQTGTSSTDTPANRN
jgi:hypothetical protein